MKFLFLSILLIAVILSSVMAMPSVVASVRGKKFDVDADTVDEFLSKTALIAGFDAQEHTVLWKSKVLSGDDNLETLGVRDGDVLMVVKGRRFRPKADPIEESTASAAMSSDAYNKAIESGANPEELKKAMHAMDNLLDSNFVDDYFSDEERLETARKQMLENLDQYEQMMPGFKEQAREIASDPQKWREAMNEAREQLLKLKKQRDAMNAKKSQQPPSSRSVDDFDDEDL